MHERQYSEFGLRHVAPVNGRYQTAANYQSYRFNYKSQRHEHNVASQMQKRRKKVAVEIKDEAFNGQNSICVIKVSTEGKLSGDSLQIHESTAVWLFR